MSSHVHIGMYNALKELGASEESARAAVADFPMTQHLATKEDLLQALSEIRIEIASLRAEIANEFKGLYRWLLVSAVSITAVIVGILKLFP